MPAGPLDFRRALFTFARDAVVAGQSAGPVFGAVAHNAGSAIHNAALHVAATAPLALAATAQNIGAVTETTLHAVRDAVAAALSAAPLIAQDTAFVAHFAALHAKDGLVEGVKQASEKIRAFYRDNPKMVTVALIGLGLALALPPVGILVLNALGWQAGGVAAGSAATVIQSILYGANTAGVFSVLQSIGATAVVSLPALIAGLGIVGTALGLKFANEHQAAALLASNGTGVLQLSNAETTPLLQSEGENTNEEVREK
ncbi:hypothetical protein CONPUDRAFT_85776 [Coniophora puteana RWD-64-598 SS2]|uniref:Uncharacterized protein n=1 Tax=Coniophora puteana (strain RWD-64-598) TaxID=741705 RepID=R7SFG4_CONPW|nr:uncharacterized protein CONPUDRAFT_85776 [Coniophora puteana RWD-64-598 SS2]EIW74615.1 hypothetical protein CONPUDRAFT_85776 [Coniophora puteana RWD-64-598 SS2]